MSTLDATRAELALIVLYLNKAEARDKICRAIQYGSKFLSNGEPGTAQNVDKQTSLARKVFRLFKVLYFFFKFMKVLEFIKSFVFFFAKITEYPHKEKNYMLVPKNSEIGLKSQGTWAILNGL